ncbi:molybdopterin-dependent oxidoreductase [Desulfococcaceae bacterium HSG8]|nr:molybdopterin-dependent oxidoreductase [Desulfococcaceae bacterium HSG8]
MKIGRRSFLSFVIGGAAGTALTPLPWKLTDDLSIWTQMWPWTPVPEDGEVSYTNSVCTLCPAGCGISVRKIEDRAVKIEGAEGYPASDGNACILGLSGLQLLYGPTRVRMPLKKENGKWKEISWDEAISQVVNKLSDLRSNDESPAVACISGSDYGTVPRLLRRFMTAYGSPNFMTVPSMQDSYALTLKLMHGVSALAGFDFENSNFVLSFGSGLIEGWGSSVRMFKAKSLWKEKGGKLVQVEQRLSNTAAKADQWVAVNPGTEAVLALGLANVIITQSLYDKAFVENHASGFDAFKKIVTGFSPDKVAKITGVEESAIISLAKAFAGASEPVAVCGRGQGKTPGSLHEFMAVHALNALVGNINKKGGVWAVPEPDYIKWPEPELDEVAQKGLATPRADGAGSEKYPDTKSLLNQFPKAVCAAEESPVKVLFVSGANPCYTLPGTKAVKEAFDKIPFVISFSSFMDETAQAADLILPNHGHLERYQDVPTPAALQNPLTGLAKPVVEPLFNTRHTGDVVIALAKGVGGSVADAFAWDSYEACLEETMGDNWDTLLEKGFVAQAFEPPGWDSAFTTSSGKFEFISQACMAESHQAAPGKIAIEGDNKKFPLILMPYDSIRLANGFIGNTPFLTKTLEDTILKGQDTVVQINPKTAKSRFIFLDDGDYAILSTPKGRVKVRVNLFEGVMPGVVAIPRGLGHTAYDDYLAGKGSNFNELISPVDDPVSGLDAAWGIRAKLTNVPL